jgi:hypothetical protein
MAAILKLKRPAFTRRDLVFLCNNIAAEIAKENHGHYDPYIFDAKLFLQMQARPELVDLSQLVRSCRKYFERLNHQALTRSEGGVFVPGAYVTVAKRDRVLMREMKLADLIGWAEIDRMAEQNFMKGQDRKRAYREERVREAGENPDCVRLGDLEAKLHGYVRAPDDDTAHLVAALDRPEADDDE